MATTWKNANIIRANYLNVLSNEIGWQWVAADKSCWQAVISLYVNQIALHFSWFCDYINIMLNLTLIDTARHLNFSLSMHLATWPLPEVIQAFIVSHKPQDLGTLRKYWIQMIKLSILAKVDDASIFRMNSNLLFNLNCSFDWRQQNVFNTNLVVSIDC